mmetsp:Transcript_24184/g.38642  ORF Transcript_24184/g.38642 Transcript_24184/m.38642 type:complete len:218 (+) Transcript_24184:46-699(+)
MQFQMAQQQVGFVNGVPMQSAPGNPLKQCMLCMGCIIFCCLTLPAFVEISLGALKLSASCGRPLAVWLLVDGGVALAISCLQLALGYRMTTFDEENHMQVAVQGEEQDISLVASYGEQFKVMNECEKAMLATQQCIGCIPLGLIIMGWIFWAGRGLCEDELSSWTLTVLLFKTLLPIIMCWCAVPCLLCGSCLFMHAMAPHQQGHVARYAVQNGYYS